jgi:hypothetical protein
MSRPGVTLLRDDGSPWVEWRLTIISQGVVLFTTNTRSRQEAEALAADAWRLRPDVKIFIRPPDGVAYGADPRQLELDLDSLLIPSRPS